MEKYLDEVLEWILGCTMMVPTTTFYIYIYVATHGDSLQGTCIVKASRGR